MNRGKDVENQTGYGLGGFKEISVTTQKNSAVKDMDIDINQGHHRILAIKG